jgi:hypothetical protein
VSEEILLFDRLYLAANAVEVSQPLPVGSANQIEIHAWIESGIAITSPAPVVQLQTSPDMDNFADKFGFNVTLYSAPGSDTRGSGGSYDQLTGNFIRMKAQGGNEDVLLSVSVRLFHT